MHIDCRNTVSSHVPGNYISLVLGDSSSGRLQVCHAWPVISEYRAKSAASFSHSDKLILGAISLIVFARFSQLHCYFI